MRVLYVEDSASLLRSVVAGLRDAGFHVDGAADGEAGLWQAQQHDYDVIVLDLLLPGLAGLEVLRRLRKAQSPARVLILSARDAVEDRVRGLDAGADDYLVKPFAFEELLARVRALVRRRYDLADDVLVADGVRFDLRAQTVTVGGQPLDLPRRELALLELLLLHRGRVVGRAEIEARIYDELVQPLSNVVDAAVSVLRRRLREAGAPPLVQTRRGLGYVIQ